MKIGFLRHPSSSIERNWIIALSQRGYEMHVIYFEGDLYSTSDASKDFPDLVKLSNVHLHCIGTGNLMSSTWMSNQNRALKLLKRIGGGAVAEQVLTAPKAIALRLLLQKIKPDILHAHMVDYYGYWGAKSHYHPFIATAWGSDILVTPKKSPEARRMVQYALSKADTVTTINSYIRDCIIKQFGIPSTKVFSFEWGIDLNIFHKGYDSEVAEIKRQFGIDNSFVLFSPRYIREHYRIDNIVKAMPLVLEKHPSANLVLLRGLDHGNDYEAQIERLIDELGIANHVKLIKREVTQHEMAVLYNASGACISIPKTDGFGFSIQETMACGTVPIVSDLEVYHQYLTNNFNALYVDGNDPSKIAERIIYCIEHPEDKERFHTANKRITDNYCDWSRNVDTMEDLYDRIARRRK